MKIGFIGLGSVGGELAGSLLRNGFDLAVRDLDLFEEGAARYGARVWSSGILRRLEEACGVELRAPGFPAEPVDAEPEAPGHEVRVRRVDPD